LWPLPVKLGLCRQHCFWEKWKLWELGEIVETLFFKPIFSKQWSSTAAFPKLHNFIISSLCLTHPLRHTKMEIRGTWVCQGKQKIPQRRKMDNLLWIPLLKKKHRITGPNMVHRNNSLRNEVRKCIFFPKRIVDVPSESTPKNLSNEWSCQYFLTFLHFWAISVSCPWWQKSPSVLKRNSHYVE
jgi:hypothetical protein